MAVKYRVEYTSVDNVDYQIDISNPTYVGSVISVEGSATYNLNAVKDASHPIRSKYLQITLNADTDNPLDDLLTQPERYWRVEFFRDSNKIFFGYISSENTPIDFVNDKWTVEVDALDPLAFLEDLSYVDLVGAKYNGHEQLARIIANCLKRGFEDQSEAFNMLSYEYFDYQTESTQYTGGRLLKDTTTIQDIFTDEESGESEGCMEVLTKILDSLQMTVTQINGDTWLLEHYLFSRALVTSTYINSYDKDGNDIADLPEVPFNPIQIKSNSGSVLDTDILHAKENQTYHYKRGWDKIVVDNQYKYKESLLENPDLDGGENGVSMPGWSVGGDYSEATDQGYLEVLRYDSGVNTNALAATSTTSVKVEKDQLFKVRITAQANYDNAALNWNVLYESDLGSDYRLGTGQNGNLEFVVKWHLIASSQVNNRVISVPNGELVEYEFEIPKIVPSTPGDLTVEIYAATPSVSGNTTDRVQVHSVDIIGLNDNISGKSRVVTADTNVSINSEKQEIYLANGEGNVLQNQMYKLSIGDPIISIKDKFRDNTAFYPIGRIYSWNRLAHYRQKRIFNGGFWNFFEPHKIMQIPDLDVNNWRIIEYSFNTAENTGDVVLEEVTSAPIDHSHSVTDIYKETIKPKIE